MAVLEKIRKQTTVLILIIGLALFAFIISGVFGNNSDGAKVGSAVAEVNGEEISIDNFRRKVESASRQYGGASSIQVVNSVWNQELRGAVLGEQFDDLGIDVEQDQIINFIKSNPSYSQSPQFLDESGVFDEYKFREYIANLKANNPARYQLWLQDEKKIIQGAKEQIYFNLIKAGVGATLKEGELDYKLSNDKVDIKYVRVPYTSIVDSTIKVSKSEITAYINNHKADFKQEKSRDLQFVYFEEKASLTDENNVKQKITSLIGGEKGFRSTKDVAAFLDSGDSDAKFDTIYKAKKELPAKFADTLMTLAVGELYGPYKEGGAYKVSKMINRKANGSVKASHILISYKGAQRAKEGVTRTKEEAEAKAKELLKEANKRGVLFTTLARENSDGPSATKGGDLGYFQQGQMVPKFNDFAFGNKVGSIGLVETDFGFHVIKVDDKEDIVQIAILTRKIEASGETVNKLFSDATQFEMESIDGKKAFADLAKEKTYDVKPVNKIKELDENLPGLGAQRSIVQWAFNEDTEIGAIKRFNVNNGYVIAQLTATYKEGLMNAEDASATVLPKVRKEKKAAQIIEANKGKSLEDFAKSNNVSASIASALTVKSPTIPGSGREPLVVGTAFALDQDETSGLIQGESGVFMLKVAKKEEATKLDNYSTYANSLKSSGAARVNTAVYSALKEGAEIIDNRASFY